MEEKKNSKFLTILLGVAILLLLCAIPTVLLVRSHVVHDVIYSRNASAQSCYSAIIARTDLESRLPQDDVIISGDITDFRIIDLDAGPVSEKPLILAGVDETSDAKLYFWSARCSGGRIKELWFSESLLSTGELRPYKYDDQKKQAGYIGNIGYKVIGYYAA